MLSVVILIAVFVQFAVSPAIFFVCARLFRSRVSAKRVLLGWLALLGLNLVGLLVSVVIKTVALSLLFTGGLLVLTVWMTLRLLRLPIWRGLGALVLASVLSVAAALGVRAVAVEAFLVPIGSMAPTIMPGDRLLADKLTPRFIPPRRGDVIVYEYVESEAFGPEPARETHVKRIAGLPGDLVEVRSDQVYVNDSPVGRNLARSWLDAEARPFEGRIPEGKMYVVGDNRGRSKDSRMFGLMDLSSIKGKAVIIYASAVPERTFAPPPPRWAESMPMPAWDGRTETPGRIRWERIGKVIR